MALIAVIGTGYVGLTTGTVMASQGHEVTCVDLLEDRIAMLQGGRVPFVEPGLGVLLTEAQQSNRLTFTTCLKGAVESAEFIFLCVQTPQSIDGSADLTYIKEAATAIGPYLSGRSVVVNKSTVPVGSTLVVEEALGRSDVPVVSNPEFLREGNAVADCLHPDRIIIGCEDYNAAVRVAQLYRETQAPVVLTDPASAETIKYASNAFLATKISFANAIANVCEAVGADVRDVVLGMGYDHRIGFDFLKPGPGYGGSCFPKDTLALVRIAEDAGYDFTLLKGVISVNELQYDRVASRIESFVTASRRESEAGGIVALWGLTFKARTDDQRESPSLHIARRLQAQGLTVRAYDPTEFSQREDIQICHDPYSACEGADVLAVLTEWDEFRWVDLDKVRSVMRNYHIVDARNLLNRAAVLRHGFSYAGIGRS